jgi:hypothetical protein
MKTEEKQNSNKKMHDVLLLDNQSKLIATCTPASARLLRKEPGLVRVRMKNPYTLQLIRNIDLTEFHHLLINIGSETPTITTG